MNVKKILEKLKEHIGLKTDEQLAEYFGVMRTHHVFA